VIRSIARYDGASPIRSETLEQERTHPGPVEFPFVPAELRHLLRADSAPIPFVLDPAEWERQRVIAQAPGSYADLFSSTDDFLTRKREEIGRETRPR
jgi:hypothetical protein